MSVTQEIAPGAAAHVLKLLQLAEDFINLAEKGEALDFIAKAKKCLLEQCRQGGAA